MSFRRRLRLGTLPKGKGGQPDAMHEGHTQCSRPADPTDPGDAADLGIPQGLEIRLDVACTLNLRGIPIANTIRGCASSNSIDVEIATKFVVNLTRYGYDGSALRRAILEG
jgi:hypothetical protein